MEEKKSNTNINDFSVQQPSLITVHWKAQAQIDSLSTPRSIRDISQELGNVFNWKGSTQQWDSQTTKSLKTLETEKVGS